MSTENEEVNEGLDPAVESEARNMGWLPKDQFKGNPDQWVDADEFVERGKHVMPLLLANNKRLQRELLTRDAQIATLAEQLNGATSAIQKLEKHYTEANKRAVENAKSQLKAELRQARENNDVDAEFDIREKIDQLNAASAKAEDANPAPAKSVAPAPALDPEFVDWKARNDWFGVDAKRTKEIMRIGEDLRDEGNDLVGAAFLDECVRILNERNKPATPKHEAPVSKVDGVSRGARTGNGGRKSFNDLPPEARQACLDDADDLVGKNKRFSNLKDWQDHYTSIYFSQQ